MFKSFVFNQFYDLKRRGIHPMKARTNVIVLVSVLIMMFLVVIFFLNIDWLSAHVNIQKYGTKLTSKVGAIVTLLVIYGILFFVLKRNNRFEKYLEEFESLDPETQKQKSRWGIIYFLVPFFGMLVFIIVFALNH